MKEITSKTVSQVYMEYYEEMSSCENRKLREVISAIYALVYFRKVISYYAVDFDVDDVDKNSEQFDAVFKEYVEHKMEDAYDNYKSESLVKSLAAVYAREYEKMRNDGYHDFFAMSFADNYSAEYLEGFAIGVANGTTCIAKRWAETPKLNERISVKELEEIINVPAEFLQAALDAANRGDIQQKDTLGEPASVNEQNNNTGGKT